MEIRKIHDYLKNYIICSIDIFTQPLIKFVRDHPGEDVGVVCSLKECAYVTHLVENYTIGTDIVNGALCIKDAFPEVIVFGREIKDGWVLIFSRNEPGSLIIHPKDRHLFDRQPEFDWSDW